MSKANVFSAAIADPNRNMAENPIPADSLADMAWLSSTIFRDSHRHYKLWRASDGLPSVIGPVATQLEMGHTLYISEDPNYIAKVQSIQESVNWGSKEPMPPAVQTERRKRISGEVAINATFGVPVLGGAAANAIGLIAAGPAEALIVGFVAAAASVSERAGRSNARKARAAIYQSGIESLHLKTYAEERSYSGVMRLVTDQVAKSDLDRKVVEALLVFENDGRDRIWPAVQVAGVLAQDPNPTELWTHGGRDAVTDMIQISTDTYAMTNRIDKAMHRLTVHGDKRERPDYDRLKAERVDLNRGFIDRLSGLVLLGKKRRDDAIFEHEVNGWGKEIAEATHMTPEDDAHPQRIVIKAFKDSLFNWSLQVPRDTPEDMNFHKAMRIFVSKIRPTIDNDDQAEFYYTGFSNMFGARISEGGEFPDWETFHTQYIRGIKPPEQSVEPVAR